MVFKILLVMLVMLNLAGCATTRRAQVDLEMQELHNRIRQLERESQQKDRKISTLEYELQNIRAGSEEAKVVKISPEKKSEKKEKVSPHQITPRNIQLALKKAGFYKGQIDGKIGSGTKKSIEEFQKANSLTPDGVVGKKTWAELGRFLD